MGELDEAARAMDRAQALRAATTDFFAKYGSGRDWDPSEVPADRAAVLADVVARLTASDWEVSWLLPGPGAATWEVRPSQSPLRIPASKTWRERRRLLAQREASVMRVRRDGELVRSYTIEWDPGYELPQRVMRMLLLNDGTVLVDRGSLDALCDADFAIEAAKRLRAIGRL